MPANFSIGSERRGCDRRKLTAVLEIEWGSTTLQGTVRDIDSNGLFVALTPPLWLGARFSARLISDATLRLECTVRRVEPSVGNGVTFELPDEKDKNRLAELLANLPLV